MDAEEDKIENLKFKLKNLKYQEKRLKSTLISRRNLLFSKSQQAKLEEGNEFSKVNLTNAISSISKICSLKTHFRDLTSKCKKTTDDGGNLKNKLVDELENIANEIGKLLSVTVEKLLETSDSLEGEELKFQAIITEFSKKFMCEKIDAENKFSENQINSKTRSNYEKIPRRLLSFNDNWTTEDHSRFLRVVLNAKSSNFEKISSLLMKALPEKNEREIRDHYTWHLETEEVRSRQRDQVRKWRKCKNEEKLEATALQLEEESKYDQYTMFRKQSREDIEKKNRAKKEKQQKIKDWREGRRQKEQEIKIEELVQTRNRDLIQKAKLLDRYKARRNMASEQFLKNCNQINKKANSKEYENHMSKQLWSQVANRLIKSYQSSDLEKIYDALERKRAREQKQDELKLRLLTTPKKSLLLQRQPGSYMKSTVCSEVKLLKSDSKVEKTIPMSLSFIPSLKTPEWRSSL